MSKGETHCLAPEELQRKLGACRTCGWKRGDPKIVKKRGGGQLNVQVGCVGARQGTDRNPVYVDAQTAIVDKADCPVRLKAFELRRQSV